METSGNSGYVKRTQKGYSPSFKLQVIQEIECGQLNRIEAYHKYRIGAKSTVGERLRKYDHFDWEKQSAPIWGKVLNDESLNWNSK